jgi:uncharacterized protein YbjT (DUF2867 family)
MIVITAPTSQIGSKLVADLLSTGAPLRLIVRDPSKLSEAVRDQADIIEGSHGDGAILDQALGDAEAIFWLVPPDMTKPLEEAYIGFSRPLASALTSNRSLRVVAVTALGRGTPWQEQAGLVTASIHVDELLMSSGAPLRTLAMPSFMENSARQAAVIRDKGLFFGPISSDRKLPFTATRDMAMAAARLLRDPSWQGQEEVPVLGPDDLSFDDQAAIISDVLGEQVRYQEISFEQFGQQFIGRGASPSFAQGYVDMYRAKQDGIDNVVERTPANTGVTSFRQFCEQVLKPAISAR